MTEPANQTQSERYRNAVLIATGIVVIAWFVPGLAVLTVPVNYLGTHVHEMSHALVAMATGAQNIVVSVHADGSGLTESRGGSALLTSSAGYLGATAAGTALLAASRTEAGARRALGVFAVLLGVSSLLWLRGDLVGLLTGLGWLGVRAWLSTKAQGGVLLFAAQFLGLQLCVASIQSLFTLLNVSALNMGFSDAQNMADLTGIPALFWALLWCGVSLVGIVATLRHAWGRGRRSPGGS